MTNKEGANLSLMVINGSFNFLFDEKTYVSDQQWEELYSDLRRVNVKIHEIRKQNKLSYER